MKTTLMVAFAFLFFQAMVVAGDRGCVCKENGQKKTNDVDKTGACCNERNGTLSEKICVGPQGGQHLWESCCGLLSGFDCLDV